ncbi:two-component sensor histidine kinase [Desulfovibrio subterraneus]|uniref:histidine kinase n=1 Tax=Desulfovibrio subterraneus TaxID=2718620 RepID=A0A7J0BGG9_9BACT|nr:PAS domain-containing sensor histidine kinase [Desulfovibrio subterraneus]WBF66911.1 two-component sensor histidine kinase [Desulfovibrio subterraneus]GFM32638.1 two-component sensor histidine kinase [Desulfovibrio subterraneus]
MSRWQHWRKRVTDIFTFPEGMDEARYRHLKRNIGVLMAMVSIVPLCLMALINFHIYRASLDRELEVPMRGLVNKTKHSFELYLRERLSAVSFIASAYSWDELSKEQTLSRIFHIAKQEFEGLVDFGLIDAEGRQVAYVGPYNLKDKNYAEQPWFHETRIRGSFISDVFLGYRNVPHIVIAVEGHTVSGRIWVLRATINTDRFNELIASMELDAESDAFLANTKGLLQTRSRLFGEPMTQLPFSLPGSSYQASAFHVDGPDGVHYFATATSFVNPDYVLVAMRPVSGLASSWYTLRSDLLMVLVGGAVLIMLVAFKLTDILVQRVMDADRSREAAFREIEHTHKLSSIGRLAAGVAHEINNPLAIINEKAGLMKDLLAREPESPLNERLGKQIGGVLESVARCRTITHRLLGFARRMDVSIEQLDVNDVIRDVLGFLEKEVVKRSVDLRLELSEAAPLIASDRGQLQQVFLNIIGNAFEAIADGGSITIATRTVDDGVSVSVRDNGCGMSQETLSHIFEPFFTTKKGTGTGLGLSITYGIIRKLGGRIDVHSEVGEGTIFTVLLPWGKPETPAPQGDNAHIGYASLPWPEQENNS